MPEQKTYLQRITDFSKAVHDQNAYERLHFDDAKDFCEFLLPILDVLPKFVTSYAELGNAQAACVKDHVTEQEYCGFMELRHNARDSARTSIKTLNRFFDVMGMEPFADIDVNDNSKVAMVCGQVMLEHIGKLDEYEVQLQGNKSKSHTGTDYLNKAADETKANPGSACASMRGYLDAADGTGSASGPAGPKVS